MNSISSENILQGMKMSKDIFIWKKTDRIGCQQNCSKYKGSSLDTRKMIPEESLEHQERGGTIEIINICINTVGHFLLLSYLDIFNV